MGGDAQGRAPSGSTKGAPDQPALQNAERQKLRLISCSRTSDQDIDVLLALVHTARILVQQQPLVQQEAVDGRHVLLPPQLLAHQQQSFGVRPPLVTHRNTAQ